MATIEKLKVGQTLYELRRQKMGNTNVSRKACFDVYVREIAEDKRSVMASWNGNPPRRYNAREVAKLRVKKPEKKGELYGLPVYA